MNPYLDHVLSAIAGGISSVIIVTLVRDIPGGTEAATVGGILLFTAAVIDWLRELSPDHPSRMPRQPVETDPNALDLDTTGLFTDHQNTAVPDRGRRPHPWTIQAQRHEDNR
ncbi:hypothetical protein [Halorarum salinum]|uniref:Uncharacterized protein n=1 Tax=Halorarum salinum TaxID=2743089 RepID=A0A7D5LAM1_9EURY|nr:hypothetical protein [Halobaculum salinum]QLG61947.1 hypothetical protein HUG12_09540 [Halobaculum salinum]